MKIFAIIILGIVFGILLGSFFTYHLQAENSAEHALNEIYHHSYVQAVKTHKLLSYLEQNNYKQVSKEAKNMLYSSNAVLEGCFEDLCKKGKYSQLNSKIKQIVSINNEWLNGNNK